MPFNESIDFLFNTPNSVVKRRRKKQTKINASDDVLVDLIEKSKTLYEKRIKSKEKLKNGPKRDAEDENICDNFSSFIINSDSKKIKKSRDEKCICECPGSPIIASATSNEEKLTDENYFNFDLNCTSPIIGSSYETNENFQSPIIKSTKWENKSEDDEIICPLSPIISNTKYDFEKDEQFVFNYPTNSQINLGNCSSGSKSVKRLDFAKPDTKNTNLYPSEDETENLLFLNSQSDGFPTPDGVKMPNKIPENCGFVTAKGNVISIPEESLNKAKKSFEEIYEEPTLLKRDTTLSKQQNFGFTTARGKSINLSVESLQKVSTLFDDIDIEIPEKSTCEPVLSKKKNISENSRQIKRKLFAEVNNVILESENGENMSAEPKIQQNQKNIGFTTALGRKVDISDTSLSKARKFLDEIDCNVNTNDILHTQEDGNKVMEAKEKENNRSVNDSQKNSNPLLKLDNPNKQNYGFTTALGKRIDISSDSLLKSKNLFANIEVDNNLKSIDDKLNTDENEAKIIQKLRANEINFSGEIKQCIAAFMANEDCDFVGNVKIHAKRETARQIQQAKINEKMESGLSSIKRKLFDWKNTENRTRLSNFVNGKLPGASSYTKDQIQELGIKPSTLSISSSTAENFQFDAREFILNYNETETIQFEILHEEPIILNNFGFASKFEFYQSFLLTDGVDPKLISEKWFFNHYRWIIWKLASMEIAFPHIFGGRVLTVENVFKQLKFRYNIEINLCKRPALRKIMEHDDIAGKMLVICVSDIQWTSSDGTDAVGYIEVTDGWYKIPLVVNNMIHRLIEEGKLFIGQKIITQNAELIGSSNPCHPLEAPSELQLKLSMNSTRRATWDTKLGFCYVHQFLPISLSSIEVDGGVISCVKAVVARIYPIQFMERLDKTYIFRNEKMEERAAACHQQIQLKLHEKLSDQLLESTKLFDKNGNLMNLSEEIVLDPRESDDEMFAALTQKDMQDLTHKKIDKLIEYRTKLINTHKEKLEKKIQDTIKQEKEEGRFLRDRVVVPFLRILLVGITRVDTENKTSAILTLWRPSEDIEDIREGQTICFYWLNVFKKKMQLNHIPLSTTKLTKYKIIEKSSSNAAFYIPRKVYSFSELVNPNIISFPYNEVDIVGFIINIHDGSPTTVYLIDDSREIIGIRFWDQSLENFNCIRVKNVIAGCNLQRRSSSNSGSVTLIDASDYSIFTQVPKDVHLLKAMVKLKENDFDDLTELGMQKLKAANIC